jgi:hypothetical protein
MHSMVRSSLLALLGLAAAAPLAAQASKPVCAADNAGLKLPPGFCALVVAESIGPARHLVVLENGDLLVATAGPNGGVRLLRDTSGDGKADIVRAFGVGGGTGIAFHGEYLYFATNNTVVRWHWQIGQLEPPAPGTPDTVVTGLTMQRSHAAKSIAIGADGQLYVNIGAPSNSCQVQDRAPDSPGQDPCPLLDSAGGIWRFDPRRSGQRQSEGQRYATGLRNAVALAVDPGTGSLFVAQHGRDQLAANWSKFYTEAASSELPAEEVFRLEAGGDYGWPYCYYDWRRRTKVLMPEYGGDGRTVGERCESVSKTGRGVSRPLGPRRDDVLQQPHLPAQVSRRVVHRVPWIVESHAGSAAGLQGDVRADRARRRDGTRGSLCRRICGRDDHAGRCALPPRGISGGAGWLVVRDVGSRRRSGVPDCCQGLGPRIGD